MHANSNTDFQDPIPVQYSTVQYSTVQYSTVHSNCVSSNRIKIQENSINSIIRNRLLLQIIHFRNAFEAVFTETSRTAILHEEVLQDSSAPIPAPILQGYPYTIQPYTIYIYTCTHPYIQRILHPESNSTYRRQRAL